MELDKLKKFIKFMNDNNLSELEIEEEGKRIRLRRNSDNQPVVIPQSPTAGAPKEEVKEVPPKKSGAEIKSPMVGTFYRAPSPGTKPYVEVGDSVKSGDVICIIEAMKLMNEIKAELGGKITQISAENGQAVEFGQVLFVVE
jgi:acetyl-CoA carboxylase biotin carboxyl carrier protein